MFPRQGLDKPIQKTQYLIDLLRDFFELLVVYIGKV